MTLVRDPYLNEGINEQSFKGFYLSSCLLCMGICIPLILIRLAYHTLMKRNLDVEGTKKVDEISSFICEVFSSCLNMSTAGGPQIECFEKRLNFLLYHHITLRV